MLDQAVDWLGRPGTAVIELAPDQASAAAEVAGRLGFDDVRVEPDLAGRPRALVARATPAAQATQVARSDHGKHQSPVARLTRRLGRRSCP